MSIAAIVVAAALLLGWWWPRWMVRTIQAHIDARWALVAWPAAQAMFVSLWLGAISLLTMPGHLGIHDLSAEMSCLSVLSLGAPTQVETAGGATVLAATTAAIVWVGILVTHAQVRARRSRKDCLESLRLVGQRWDRFPDVWWLNDQRPIAFCLPGRHAGIAATTGLRETLTGDELEAVMAHERAHRRQHHHTIVLIAGILGRALPFIPLFACGAQEVDTLVEQAADARAAQQLGASIVGSALRILARATPPSGPPDGVLSISNAASTTRRQQRLLSGRHCDTRGHHVLTAVTVAGVVVTPIVIVAISAISALAVACGL